MKAVERFEDDEKKAEEADGRETLSSENEGSPIDPRTDTLASDQYTDTNRSREIDETEAR